MAHEQWDVFASLSQRRKANRESVEPVIQIFAESAFLNGFGQIGVGDRHYAHIDSHGRRISDRLKFFLLQHAQQFRLAREREAVNFVENDRSTVRQFEAALAILNRAGEGAFLVTEQFAFEQCFGQRGAIDLDQWPSASAAVKMNGLGDQLLPCPAFTLNQDGSLGLRDQTDQAADLAYLRALSNDAGEVEIDFDQVFSICGARRVCPLRDRTMFGRKEGFRRWRASDDERRRMREIFDPPNG